MKRLYYTILFVIFCLSKSFAQCNDAYYNISGNYHNSFLYPFVGFELFSDGQYLLQLCKGNNYNDMLNINCDWSTGSYIIIDSLVMCYSDSNILIFTFQIVDSLNMKVIYSEKEFLAVNDFLYRIAAYFPAEYIIQRWDPFGDGCYSRWVINYDGKSTYDGKSIYKCYYRSIPKKTLIMFDYDSVKYLFGDIYIGYKRE